MTQLFVGNDIEVQVNSLTDQSDSAVTGATVDLTLTKADGTVITTGTFTDSGSGDYAITIASSEDINVDEEYDIKVEAVKGSTKQTWEERKRAQKRRF